jgi:hypothetical protein
MPKEEIHVRFRGLEGEPWPSRPPKLERHLVGGLLPSRTLPQARAYYEAVAEDFLCDLIYLEPFTHMGGETVLPRDFVLLGFDFGHFVFSEDYTQATSKVYSNIIFGETDELREMAGALNENLLFGDHRQLKQFSRYLTRLLATKDSAMEESSLGQWYSIYGLPASARRVTKRFYEEPMLLE